MNDLPRGKTDSDLDVMELDWTLTTSNRYSIISLGSSNTVALVLYDRISVKMTISKSDFQFGYSHNLNQ